MSGDLTNDRTAIDRVLLERAEHLARPLVEAHSAPTIEVLHFELAGERYAVATAFVQQIARRPKIFAVPGIPAHFVGIAVLHDESLVVDLRLLFGLAPDSGEAQHVVFLGRDRVEFGILVDTLLAIDSIDPQAVQPSSAADGERSLAAGMLPDAEVVLDGAALLDDPRFFVESTPLPVSQGVQR